MAGTSDIRNGLVIRYNGELYKVVDFQHFKMGRGGAKVRTKLKSIPDGNVIEETFRPNDKFEDVRLEARQMQFLYRQGDAYNFMDTRTYEQVTLPNEICEDASQFMKENEEVKILFDGMTPVDIKLPVKVDLEVEKAPPGVLGNTAQGGDKTVTLETGYKVKVPLFIEEGDVVRIDTRTGEYKERVNT